MPWGFVITERVSAPEELTPRKMAIELYANGQLNESESEVLLPTMVECAKSLMNAYGEGPYIVTLEGVDGRARAERSVVTLTVESLARRMKP